MRLCVSGGPLYRKGAKRNIIWPVERKVVINLNLPIGPQLRQFGISSQDILRIEQHLKLLGPRDFIAYWKKLKGDYPMLANIYFKY